MKVGTGWAVSEGCVLVSVRTTGKAAFTCVKTPRKCPGKKISFKKPQYVEITNWVSVQFSSVAQLCPTLYNPMDCSTPGLPVHH